MYDVFIVHSEQRKRVYFRLLELHDITVYSIQLCHVITVYLQYFKKTKLFLLLAFCCDPAETLKQLVVLDSFVFFYSASAIDDIMSIVSRQSSTVQADRYITLWSLRFSK